MTASEDHPAMPDDASGRSPDEKPKAPAAAPLHCTDGETLCRVRVFTEAEWEAMPESERPARSEFVPGVGWVAAVPEQNLN
jgi:hypothetical protein